MPDLSFSGLLVVAAIAFGAPLLLGLAPTLRIPAAVVELVAGIAVGPSGLGWVELDPAIEVVALLGLAFLLFLAGLELELRELRGAPLRLALKGFAATIVLALAAGLALDAAGATESTLLVAIALMATSLGLVVPVLKDARESATPFGQLVIAAASIADVGAIVLLSLFFSREASGTGTKLVLLGGFVALALAVGLAVSRFGRSMRLGDVLVRLQDTTAQIRVRGAFVLLAGFAALAEGLGLEVILGAFTAGAVLALVDRDQAMTHPQFRLKLEAAGYGIFVPVFFVASGLRFDLDALTSGASTLARVPLILAALLLARGLPALLLYRSTLGSRHSIAAALLQATSLPFLVATAQIGMELGTIGAATGAALVSAGLLSVLIFPAAALLALPAPEGRDERAAGLVAE